MISGSLTWSKTLMELIFNPRTDLKRSVQMLKREWGAKSNGEPPHLFISSKSVTLVPEFAVEDLSLDRTSTLVPAFALWTELQPWFLR